MQCRNFWDCQKLSLLQGFTARSVLQTFESIEAPSFYKVSKVSAVPSWRRFTSKFQGSQNFNFDVLRSSRSNIFLRHQTRARDIYDAINDSWSSVMYTIYSPKLLNAVSTNAFADERPAPNSTRWESIEAKISVAHWLARKPNSRKRDQRPLTTRDSNEIG